MNELTKNERIVMRAYALDKDCVNDDKKLLTIVWNMQGWRDDLSLAENLRKVSNPESLTRARRKLHERGLIEYTKDADKRRYEQFKQAREEFSSKPVYKAVHVSFKD